MKIKVKKSFFSTSDWRVENLFQKSHDYRNEELTAKCSDH